MALENNYILWREAPEPDEAATEQRIREIDSQLELEAGGRERADLLLNKGVLSGMLHRVEEAKECFRQAAEQNSSDADVCLAADFGGAALLDQEGKPQEALDALTRVLQKYEDRLRLPDAAPVYVDLQQRRALNLICLEQVEDAIPLLHECLSSELTTEVRAVLLYHLGYCQFSLEHYENAAPYFVESCSVVVPKTWEGKSHFFLGASYFKLGRLEEAKSELLLCERNAIEYQVPMEQVYEGLSAVSRDLGDRVSAETYARLQKELSGEV